MKEYTNKLTEQEMQTVYGLLLLQMKTLQALQISPRVAYGVFEVAKHVVAEKSSVDPQIVSIEDDLKRVEIPQSVTDLEAAIEQKWEQEKLEHEGQKPVDVSQLN